jgi:hypothetical protein
LGRRRIIDPARESADGVCALPLITIVTSFGGKIALVCCELVDVLIVTFIRIDVRNFLFHRCCCCRELHKHSKQQQSSEKEKLSVFLLMKKEARWEMVFRRRCRFFFGYSDYKQICDSICDESSNSPNEEHPHKCFTIQLRKLFSLKDINFCLMCLLLNPFLLMLFLFE